MPKRRMKKLPKVVTEQADAPGLITAVANQTAQKEASVVLRNLKRAHAARQRSGL